jgi:hypothetical protein
VLLYGQTGAEAGRGTRAQLKPDIEGEYHDNQHK